MLAPAALAAAGGETGFPGVGPSAAPVASGEVAARGPAGAPVTVSRFDVWALAAVGLLCGLGWLVLTALYRTARVRAPAARRPAQPVPPVPAQPVSPVPARPLPPKMVRT